MGQKVHPRGYRLGITTEHQSRWYADSNKPGERYADFVREDIAVRNLVSKAFTRAGISKINIERSGFDKIAVEIHSAKPGIIIGKGGEQAEKTRAQIANLTKKSVKLSAPEIRNVDADANVIAQVVAEKLANRVTFRRAMRFGIQNALKSGALGIKIMCSGRLGGAEMSRSEFYREGSVPLHTLRSYVDYGFAEAHTTFGRIGVKVWVYKGEVTEKEWENRAGGRNERNNRRNDQNRQTSAQAPAPAVAEVPAQSQTVAPAPETNEGGEA